MTRLESKCKGLISTQHGHLGRLRRFKCIEVSDWCL